MIIFSDSTWHSVADHHEFILQITISSDGNEKITDVFIDLIFVGWNQDCGFYINIKE